MKLTIFGIAAVSLLLLAAGYLTIKSDFEEKMQAQQDEQRAHNEAMLKQVEAMQEKTAAAAASAAMVSSPPPVLPADAGTPAPAPAPASPTAATVNPAPAINPVAATGPAPVIPREQEVLDMAVNDRVGNDIAEMVPEDNADAPRTAVQRRILAQPAIARVKEFSSELGAVVLDRGSRVNLAPGSAFAIRRKVAIIGRIRISETVEEDQCVADVLANSMPLGMAPMPGDEIIQFEP